MSAKDAGRASMVLIAGSAAFACFLAWEVYLSVQLESSAQRIQAKVNPEAQEPLALTFAEMCLESCVKGPADLGHIRLFGADPGLRQSMEREVLRPLLQPGLLAAPDLIHGAHLEPPYLVQFHGPAETGKKSIVMELARSNNIPVLQLDKASLESAQKAARWTALSWSPGGSVVRAAFSLARKLRPCIILLDKPHELPRAMQAALRAELERLQRAPHNWPQERLAVVATSAELLWQPPFQAPVRHQFQTALPTPEQLGAMLHGFLQLLEQGVQQQQQQQQQQQWAGGQAVQPQLLAALASYADGGPAGAAGAAAAGGALHAEVHLFLLSLQGRTAAQMKRLMLRARQLGAGANDAWGLFEPLALGHLEAALQDLVQDERQRQGVWWRPGSWSAGTRWVCAGLVGGVVVAAALRSEGGRRSIAQLLPVQAALVLLAGSAAIGGLVVWRLCHRSAQLEVGAQRIQAKVNREAQEPLTLTFAEMCLESCVKGPADLGHIRLFGADPGLRQSMEREVLRPLLQPGLLAAPDLIHGAHLEPPYLVQLVGPDQTGKKSVALELAREHGITVLQLDKPSLESAQQAAGRWPAGLGGGGGSSSSCSVVRAAFSLARKLRPCIILLDKPHELPRAMQAALRAELERLQRVPHNWPQERLAVVATSAELLWQPPFQAPVRHQFQTALPTPEQLGAMLYGFLQLLEQGVQQQQQWAGGMLGGGQAVQPQLLAALAHYVDGAPAGAAGAAVAGGVYGAEVQRFLLSLQGRTAPQMKWLVLRARHLVAGVTGGAWGLFRPLALGHLQAALRDLVQDERQRQGLWWWPGSWSAGARWVCAGLVGGVVVAAALGSDEGGLLPARSAAARLRSNLPGITASTDLRLTTLEALVARFVQLPCLDAAKPSKCELCRANPYLSQLSQYMRQEAVPHLLQPPLDLNMPSRGLLMHDPSGAGVACLLQALAAYSMPVNVMMLDAGVVNAVCEAASGSLLLPELKSRRLVVESVFTLARRLSPCVVVVDKPQELEPFLQAAFIKAWHRTATTAPAAGSRPPFVAVVVRSATPCTFLAPLFSRRPALALEQLVPVALRLAVMYDARVARYVALRHPQHVQAAAAAELAVVVARQAWSEGAARLTAAIQKWLREMRARLARRPARRGIAGALDNILATFQQRSFFAFWVAVTLSVEVRGVGWW
ncbi:hypothetical protein HXX76_011085 [Chlamydomonas incerta]|uniref:AAA+ ATPase domain-containing protein n=1 Tax=Chlamydomonas incerta TaxID=51695 RepID=A0A835SQ91_CHLIN|nr:hypothetical protein HXX76_011085 [Chlamydomonas incerta]|eukprot:KAG2429317.1 hypothetical protein HXX76_011085 [Chlamydomonas incerta]